MKRTIEFASHPANLWLVRHCVREFLLVQNFHSREVDLMVLGVDEACTNIIRHAYQLEDDQLITLILETCGGGVRFQLRDFGARCDFENFEGRSLEQLRPGGLGMHLIRHAFDQVSYFHRRKGTLLQLTKFGKDSPSLSAEFAAN